MVLTAGRMGEINNLKWEDVDFEGSVVTLWTRKRKGGNKEYRYVPMIEKLQIILERRYADRDTDMPWVFWYTSWSKKRGCRLKGPYQDRKK
jgi:integrase